MRTSSSINDENSNRILHSKKSSLLSSSVTREVLSEVTNHHDSKFKKLKFSNSASKFKKPKLFHNSVNKFRSEIDSDNSENSDNSDNYISIPDSDDIEPAHNVPSLNHLELTNDSAMDKENRPMDDIDQSSVPHSGIGNSEIDENDKENISLDQNDITSIEDKENTIPNHQKPRSLDENDDHSPMTPKWNRQIFNELQQIMKKYSRNILDENDEDTYDVTMVAEYSPEIFNYLHELENKLTPDGNYMVNQDELKWEMRAVLIDWVVQVHSRFNLLPETLFLTVNYIDRFLSKRKVSLSRFQLVGAVALFIAAKYEEINCPTVQEVAFMADNAYSIDEFLKAERFMIDVLEFDMGWPGPMSFLRRTSKADDYDYETRTLAKYFLEVTIMDSRFVASPPSWLAAGAHYLSRKILKKGNWSELHVFYSGYTELQLRPLAEILLYNCRHAETNHKAIFEKYQERRYRRSSTFVQDYFQSIE